MVLPGAICIAMAHGGVEWCLEEAGDTQRVKHPRGGGVLGWWRCARTTRTCRAPAAVSARHETCSDHDGVRTDGRLDSDVILLEVEHT